MVVLTLAGYLGGFAHYHNGCGVKHNRQRAAVKLSTALICPSARRFKSTASHLQWENMKAGGFTVCAKMQWWTINDSAAVWGVNTRDCSEQTGSRDREGQGNVESSACCVPVN